MVPSSVDDARISESAVVKCLPASSRGPEEIGEEGVRGADDAGAGSPPPRASASASPSATSDGSVGELEQVITELTGASMGVNGVTPIGCL
jgi:hypothetical protein